MDGDAHFFASFSMLAPGLGSLLSPMIRANLREREGGTPG